MVRRHDHEHGRTESERAGPFGTRSSWTGQLATSAGRAGESERAGECAEGVDATGTEEASDRATAAEQIGTVFARRGSDFADLFGVDHVAGEGRVRIGGASHRRGGLGEQLE